METGPFAGWNRFWEMKNISGVKGVGELVAVAVGWAVAVPAAVAVAWAVAVWPARTVVWAVAVAAAVAVI
jgi:hypothetical protein